jgi:radical SAM superfamily enzyme YgiQ (UPF0313 family)
MLRNLRDNHGVREILIEDDTFIISKERVKQFCELLIADKIGLSWSCLGRADMADPDLFKLMRAAGCWHISFGIESGSPEILRAVNKNVEIDQIRRAVSLAAQAGLQTKGFFMVGFPGETKETIAQTAGFAASLDLDDISVMQLTPFPGSELYAEACKYGSFEKDWQRMNTLETVFVPHGLTKKDIENARSKILRAFYFRLSALWKQALQALRNPSVLKFKLSGLITLLKNI